MKIPVSSCMPCTTTLLLFGMLNLLGVGLSLRALRHHR